jgi:hypothetical protein
MTSIRMLQADVKSPQPADKLNRITAGTAGTGMAMAAVCACGIADAAASSGDAVGLSSSDRAFSRPGKRTHDVACSRSSDLARLITKLKLK